MVDRSAFEVGRNIAVTPGEVVLRTEVLELIQYRPQTGQVREVPLLIVPPTINKFYALDLAPGRSMVEYLVQNGQQVFVISWRNPDARHSGWGLDTYVKAVLDALGAVERICGTGRTAVMGVCAGGIIASVMAAHLAAAGQQDRLACFACWSPCSTPQTPAPPPRWQTSSWRQRRRRCRRAAATSTAEPWPRRSPGCAPVTWCGTTG